jgi:hypothetical protein
MRQTATPRSLLRRKEFAQVPPVLIEQANRTTKLPGFNFDKFFAPLGLGLSVRDALEPFLAKEAQRKIAAQKI